MSGTVGDLNFVNPSEPENYLFSFPASVNDYAQSYAHPVHRSIALHYYLRWSTPM